MASDGLSTTQISSVSTTAKMKLLNGEMVEEVLSIPVAHWELMGRFLEEVQRLRATKAVAAPSALSFTWGVDANGPFFEERSMPTNDELWALLNVLRPFVLANEESYYPSVRKKLAKRVEHPMLSAFLDRGLEMFLGKRVQQGGVFVSANVVLNSDEMLMKWLNAYEYHRDKDKRDEFEALHGELLPMPLTRAIYIVMLMDKARAVIELGGLISCMQRSAVFEQLRP